VQEKDGDQLDRSFEKRIITEKEKRKIQKTIKRRQANRISHILSRKCLLKHVTAEKTEGFID